MHEVSYILTHKQAITDVMGSCCNQLVCMLWLCSWHLVDTSHVTRKTHAMTMQMVHEDDELYSVTEMATLLFGNQDPTSCYASHRLLSQERIFFKQAGRSPPRFQARSAKEVHALKAKRTADEKVSTGVSLAFVSRCMYITNQIHQHTAQSMMFTDVTDGEHACHSHGACLQKACFDQGNLSLLKRHFVCWQSLLLMTTCMKQVHRTVAADLA